MDLFENFMKIFSKGEIILLQHGSADRVENQRGANNKFSGLTGSGFEQ